ncbi:MAG: type I restriction enzyme HsdR N-terminal domain-containing protein [Bacteroidales bacterium]|nr:type I restriction enzyme HsdR N-terminal domain-containing protein [Bacteroidales bacterium]
MEQLNLPPADLKVIEDKGLVKVFDPYRKKYVKLTPEEYVRQSFLSFLAQHLHYPIALTAVEHLVEINGLKQRADIVIYDRTFRPYLIVECKAASVPITKEVFAQALRYNTRLGVRYVVVTNGLAHYCAEIADGKAVFLKEVPVWKE